jgi:uncharacterized protein (TIGR03546 family)
LLKPIAKLFLALNGNVKKTQIAAGFAWGILLGLLPAGNFFFIVLFVCSFVFRHHHWSKLLVMAVIKLLSPIIIFPLDSLGWQILHIESLVPIFTAMYNIPFVPFTGFNNTLVAAGLTLGLILWIPSYFIFFGLVTLYRNHIAEKLRNSELLKKIAKLPFLKLLGKALD